MSALNKSQFLAAILGANIPTLTDIDGVGEVYLKKLTVAEQGEITKKGDDSVQASLYVVAYSVCDEQGERLFGDKDIKELGKMNAEQMGALIGAINRLNRFDEDEAQVQKNS